MNFLQTHEAKLPYTTCYENKQVTNSGQQRFNEKGNGHCNKESCIGNEFQVDSGVFRANQVSEQQLRLITC